MVADARRDGLTPAGKGPGGQRGTTLSPAWPALHPGAGSSDKPGPPGVLPTRDWTPPGGGRPRLDRVPTVVRAWYELPFLDGYAHVRMWQHDGWDVAPFP